MLIDITSEIQMKYLEFCEKRRVREKAERTRKAEQAQQERKARAQTMLDDILVNKKGLVLEYCPDFDSLPTKEQERILDPWLYFCYKNSRLDIV